ncbi:type II toxin-antitoxin system HicB family antitoxin [Cyanobium sp. BA20m-p-22]|uniref:type II toxin-antitoxin system HicB family antitoxin n=1 Tax=Cyanobium sp. BA20m-p-22 TaxID=2823704 RepID=UPI0020CC26FA|nr:type II toxin-antitoxin system HicB family antitoxin [Cyanobium sp. BA20m-p-22]MCP9910320.1 type II toxin-antitoxin system HicB family antitoxin [Cyanobium sp. BA20m-p-22]
MSHTYAVVIEPTGTGFSAYVPDLPGCVAAGSTREAVRGEIRAAIQLHLDGLPAMAWWLRPPAVRWRW